MDHDILCRIINQIIKDKGVLQLIRVILNNYHTDASGKGMPLGNWTSQFFANIYLDELDQYIKTKLKIKYYIRYVDDFVIFHKSKQTLKYYRANIERFLSKIKLELHPTKSKIIPLSRGVCFLGYRIFYHFRLPRKRNILKAWKRIDRLLEDYESGMVKTQDVISSINGWNAYAMHANTYQLRRAFSAFAIMRMKEISNRII